MYKEFYGFQENPFELTYDPRFIFLPPGHQLFIASIKDCIQNRKEFISVIGEAGTGKTILMHYLIDQLPKQLKTVFLFHTTISFCELVKTIHQDLGLSILKKDKQGLIDEVIHYSKKTAAEGGKLVFIIDEAQDLPVEVMEEIEKYFNPESCPVQVIFVGQTKFEERFCPEDFRPFKPHWGSRYRIQPLTFEESKAYIHHRLRLIGKDSMDLFTQRAILEICDYAQGIPRTLNTTCDNAFLMGFRLSKKKIDADIIGKVIQELEGPVRKRSVRRKTTSLDIAGPGRRSAKPVRLGSFTKRTSIVIVVLVCLAGIVLFTGRSLRQRPMKTGEMGENQSPISIAGDKKPSANQPSADQIDIKPSVVPVPAPPVAVSKARPSLPIDSPKEEVRKEEVIKVKEGQTLVFLAQKHYGMVNNTLLDFILDRNPEITDIDLILIDQLIKVPAVREEFLIIQSDGPSNGPTYKIHAGTFENLMAANVFIEELAFKEKKNEILSRRVSPREVWYRVVIGSFDKREEALKTIGRLKEKGKLPLFKGSP